MTWFDTIPWIFLIAAAAVVLLAGGIRRVTLELSRGTVAFGLLGLSSLASLAFSSGNRWDALVHPLGPATWTAFALIASVRLSKSAKIIISYVLYGATSVVGLIAIYQWIGMKLLPSWVSTGNPATTIALFAIVIPMIGKDFLHEKNRSQVAAALLTLAGFIALAGLAVTLWQRVPTLSAVFPPYRIAWIVAVETLKNLKPAILGVGPENYTLAYNLGKPLQVAAGPLWNIRYTAGSDFFLHMTAVQGLVGLAAAIIFVRLLLFPIARPYRAARIAAILVFVLLPPAAGIFFPVAVVYLLSFDQPLIVVKGRVPVFVRYAGAFVALGIGIVTAYALTRFTMGEIAYGQAIAAAQKNQGTESYNLLIRAIRSDPFLSRYHQTLSAVSLAIANSIVSQQTVSDQDKTLVGKLVQQAISEAKTAVTLSPQNVNAWENIGTIYQTIMPVAKDADTWADASFTKALSLDPTNPVLWVNLGGVQVYEKKLDSAITSFDRAVFLRPTYANAYYNLANAYKLKGDAANAAAAATKAMNLVEPNSSDYFKAKTLLDETRR